MMPGFETGSDHDELHVSPASRHEKARSLTRPFGTQAEELNAKFDELARSIQLPSPREIDEEEAGRTLWRPQDVGAPVNLDRALEHIRWTLAGKGEASGDRVKVEVKGLHGRERVLYTQTREYHVAGGEEMVRFADNTYGWEQVHFPQGVPFPHRRSVHLARLKGTIMAQMSMDEESEEMAHPAARTEDFFLSNPEAPSPSCLSAVPQEDMGSSLCRMTSTVSWANGVNAQHCSVDERQSVRGPIDGGIWTHQGGPLGAPDTRSVWPPSSGPGKGKGGYAPLTPPDTLGRNSGDTRSSGERCLWID